MRVFGLSLSLLATLLVLACAPAAAQRKPPREVGAVGSGRGEPSAGAEAAWRRYLDALADAGVRAPSASALRDSRRLPSGLSPVAGVAGSPVGGVASTRDADTGETVLVLPREVVAVVSGAFESVGAPYAPGDTGSGAYSCAGLVRALYGRTGITLPATAAAQLATGRRVAFEDARAGDLVLPGSARHGVRSVGLVVGEDAMVVADARSAAVVVKELPTSDTVLGVVRPSLGTRAPSPVPRGDGSLTWRCGGIPPSKPGAAGGAGADALRWGGYPNGLIPRGMLCPVDEEPHELRCDAARDFAALSRAFAAAWGKPLCLTDSYRTLGMQLAVHRSKPGLTAEPGTSAHGWGLAVDLCGGVHTFHTDEHEWMRGAAPRFGWVHPDWAREGGGREEPWHWEYAGR